MTSESLLSGITVLDLTRLLPGPMCTLMFGDLGADVIKIEDTAGGDYARYYPPMVDDQSVFFSSVNRNKRSLTLNLKTAEGVELLKSLVAEADVLIESFRPGVMDRLGVGWEVLREVNPRLVYCAISGYGQTGPMSVKAGHDINYVARTGLLHYTGKKGGPATIPAFQLADLAGGALWAAFGITSALLGRERSGEGRFVDISMTEGALMFAMPGIAASAAGATQARGDNMLSGGVPSYDVYETSDGRFLSVGPLEPKFWMGFVQAIERPDLVSEGMNTGEESDSTKAEIASILKQKTLDEWTEIFSALDVCVEPVLTFEEVLEDAQHRARQMFFTLNGIQHTRTPLTPTDAEHRPAPGQGEHTEEILRALGKTDAEIAALREVGAV